MKIDTSKTRQARPHEDLPLSTPDVSPSPTPKTWMIALAESAEAGGEAEHETYVHVLTEARTDAYRRKMLDSMGLSEQYLADMSAQDRLQVDNMVRREVHKRVQASRREGHMVGFNRLASPYMEGIGEFHRYLDL